MTFEDYNLTRRAARGDIEAFSRLVREHSGLVYRVAARILGDSDAQDASQEVWIRVWRNIKKFRGESAFSTWLYKITVNTCLSSYRREQSRQAREIGDDLSYPRFRLASRTTPRRRPWPVSVASSSCGLWGACGPSTGRRWS
jgi:RNA polymerase sigma-70 factor (ECF subfamily)